MDKKDEKRFEELYANYVIWCKSAMMYRGVGEVQWCALKQHAARFTKAKALELVWKRPQKASDFLIENAL